MRSRVWLVVLTITVCLLVPSHAMAEDRSKVQFENETIETVKGGSVLRANTTPFDFIQYYFNRLQIQTDFGRFPVWQWYIFIERMFTRNVIRSAFLAAIAMVFMWWGVRKVIRMLFRAFRKGKANV